MTRPFEGVKILDFTQVLAGPYASYQLALLGADVVKVERREGEDMRRTPLSREWAERGLAPAFQAINGNKRSLTLDLQKPDAIAIVKKLAAQVDVVMENFRPGVMDKLGIGYEALSAINPKLIYCAVSGFGQTGPDRLRPGYDGKMQALSGIMAITGHPETGPTRAGFAVCDVLSGATAAFGVSSALYQRDRTGKGQLIDVSMLEATMAFLSGQIADWSVAGHRQQLSGNQAVSRRTTANLFRCGDGHILLAVNNEKQYRALMSALGREDPRSAIRALPTGLRATRTSRRCAPSSKRRSRQGLRANGRPFWKTPARPAPASGRSRKSSTIRRSRRAARSRNSIRPTAGFVSPAADSSSRMAAAGSTGWRRSSARIRMRCWASWDLTQRRSQHYGRGRSCKGEAA
ncbi:crotonobetainyl-CoA:carnitine CoA-transferase CaiB-like acyl-CoA transferase [Bradyrhizobium sp. GM0.4]